MKTIYKACPCVVRSASVGYQLLAFQHPEAGKQLVKGTVEQGEAIELAAIRELEEESGIKGVKAATPIATVDRYAGGGPEEDGPLEHHEWRVFLIEAPGGLPETWYHEVSAGEGDRGLVFSYFWQTMPERYRGFDPKFLAIFEQVERYLELNSCP